jgi:UDP-N-acetylglucosamine/UDP-N-acetylgalactosamine diphosphorylase
LKNIYQKHLLQFFDEIDEKGKSKLIEAINNIDFNTINELIDLIKNETKVEKNIKQAKYIPLKGEDEDASLFYGKDNFHHKMHLKGEELIKQGKVASFVVAGGQGTRLGYDLPKGVYPIGPVSGKSLFQFHFESLDALQKKYKVQIPFLIMTSEMTHDDTIKFLNENKFFGYDKDNVFIFQQGKMPAIDFNGKILLSEKDSPAFSPNGHGGSLFALKDSGVLDKLIKKGIEHIFYFQIDNVMVKICEPYFFGCHINNHSDIS